VEDILDDPEATFITNGVAVGDIVYFPISATPVCATVIKVISETQLLLNQSIGPYGGWSEFYNLYDGSFSEGCVLYVGGAGDVSVTTVGGNDVTFKGINAGQFIPVNVVKVTASTTATDIIALW
jgi:hypothetical protein